VDGDGRLVAGTFLFPLTETLDEVFPLPASGRDGIAAYEMAHMTVHPQARGLDFGVVLHGLRVLFMMHEGLTAPPLWLVMSHNRRSLRLIGQIGVERVTSIPPPLLKGLWGRAHRVLAFRGLTAPPAALDDVVTTMALPRHGLNRLLRETAGALALLGSRCVVGGDLAGWLGLEPLRRVRGLECPFPWARSPLYEALWRAADA
jgi:GNAT superfamily N-acetyltransferase